ncbi:MAG: META domain-containing protein [Alphaproteobacteria bacterium]|nr:META domain-containing protein [Alphaproteobacteria bacterium]
MILRHSVKNPPLMAWSAIAIALVVAGTFIATTGVHGEPGAFSSENISESSVDELSSRFPDYVPKTSEDTVLDFRPALEERLSELPDVTAGNLIDSVDLLRTMAAEALANSGIWADGHIALGADPQEYIPTNGELLTGEFGNRIGRFIANSSPQEMEYFLSAHALADLTVRYNRFDFRHVDVMGSGRFFYASAPRDFVVLAPDSSADATTTAAALEKLLAAGTWHVMGLKDAPPVARPDGTMIRPTVAFQITDQPDQLQIGGNGFCSVYGGEMQIDRTRISLQSFRRISNACAVGMDQERRFIIALKEAANFYFAGRYFLVILDGFGNPIMLLAAAADL